MVSNIRRGGSISLPLRLRCSVLIFVLLNGNDKAARIQVLQRLYPGSCSRVEILKTVNECFEKAWGLRVRLHTQESVTTCLSELVACQAEAGLWAQGTYAGGILVPGCAPSWIMQTCVALPSIQSHAI